MTKKNTFGVQSRRIVVTHPDNDKVILFEAIVRIGNINNRWVDKIEGVKIEYKLKPKN